MRKVDANTVFGFWPKRKVDASHTALLSRMDKCGIDQSLTCSLVGLVSDFKAGNDETLRVCSQSDGRLIPVATINPQTYFGVLDEVDRIRADGFRIVRFFPTQQEWSVTQRHFTKLLESLSETDLVLMIPSTEGITNLANVTAGMHNAIIIETIRAYPQLAELIICAQENSNLYIETHLITSMDFVDLLVREVGPGRLVFGSGAPLHAISSSVLPILNAKIDEDVKENILSRNIARLLRL
jgi:predicted TIM-barrel fold metal-dependent hydrolase